MARYRVELYDRTVEEFDADGWEERGDETVIYRWEPPNVDPIAPNAKQVVLRRFPTSIVVTCRRVD
jgi:hypothetical protein